MTLGSLFDSYISGFPRSAKEKRTWETEMGHIRHLRRLLDERLPLPDVTPKVLQAYVNARAAEDGSGPKPAAAQGHGESPLSGSPRPRGLAGRRLAPAASMTDPLAEVVERLTRIEAALDTLARDRVVKEWYTTAEVAAHLGRAEYTVREWCRASDSWQFCRTVVGRVACGDAEAGLGVDRADRGFREFRRRL